MFERRIYCEGRGPIGCETFAFIQPPVFNVGIRFRRQNGRLVSHSTEVAPAIHVGKFDLVMPFPVKVTGVEVVGAVE